MRSKEAAEHTCMAAAGGDTSDAGDMDNMTVDDTVNLELSEAQRLKLGQLEEVLGSEYSIWEGSVAFVSR